MSEEELSKKQVTRGFLILLIFILLRAAISKIEDDFLFLVGAFLIGSVGLVYLGFSKWVGIDLKRWWRFNKKEFVKDIGWGILGFLICLFLMGIVIVSAIQLGFVPKDATYSTVSPASYLLSLFFGFAIASFQEEIIFRGFLQDILKERFGIWRGNVLQAAVFSIAHIGYYPLDSWPFFLSAFLTGIVFGWLRIRRGTLFSSYIAHGILG
ncbi:MAG: CPBP family intramembrane glutamic endopeptidase [Candidatus Bathyarchaeia archaeon]